MICPTDILPKTYQKIFEPWMPKTKNTNFIFRKFLLNFNFKSNSFCCRKHQKSMNDPTYFGRCYLNLECTFNLLHATGLFLYPLKTLENLWFSDVFRGYTKRPVTWKTVSNFKWVFPFCVRKGWLIALWYICSSWKHNDQLIMIKSWQKYIWKNT